MVPLNVTTGGVKILPTLQTIFWLCIHPSSFFQIQNPMRCTYPCIHVSDTSVIGPQKDRWENFHRRSKNYLRCTRKLMPSALEGGKINSYSTPKRYNRRRQNISALRVISFALCPSIIFFSDPKSDEMYLPMYPCIRYIGNRSSKRQMENFHRRSKNYSEPAWKRVV